MSRLAAIARAALAISMIAVAVVGCANVSSIGGQEAVSRISLEVGQSATVLISVHCGYQTLEIDVNGDVWSTDGLQADAAGNLVEPAWPSPGGDTELSLKLVDPDTLLATAPGSGVTHTYMPDPSPPGCD